MKWNTGTFLNILLVLMAGLLIGRYFYLKPGYTNGETAPDFGGELIGGEDWSMQEMRGHYVLLDFWGSWCAPCRRKNPELVKLYHRYKDATFRDADGFAIVSVAIERDPGSWKRAIERDGLDWPWHLLDQSDNLRFFEGSLADAYGVKQIPTTYLIDPEGTIIGVNPSARNVAERLDKALANTYSQK